MPEYSARLRSRAKRSTVPMPPANSEAQTTPTLGIESSVCAIGDLRISSSQRASSALILSRSTKMRRASSMITSAAHGNWWLNAGSFRHARMIEAYLRPIPGMFITVVWRKRASPVSSLEQARRRKTPEIFGIPGDRRQARINSLQVALQADRDPGFLLRQGTASTA